MVAIGISILLSIPRCHPPTEGDQIELRKNETAAIRIDTNSRTATINKRTSGTTQRESGPAGRSDNSASGTTQVDLGSARVVDVRLTDAGVVTVEPVKRGFTRELGIGIFGGELTRWGITVQGMYYRRVSIAASLATTKDLTNWRVGGILLYRLPYAALSNVDVGIGIDNKGEIFAVTSVKLGSW